MEVVLLKSLDMHSCALCTRYLYTQFQVSWSTKFVRKTNDKTNFVNRFQHINVFVCDISDILETH